MGVAPGLRRELDLAAASLAALLATFRAGFFAALEAAALRAAFVAGLRTGLRAAFFFALLFALAMDHRVVLLLAVVFCKSALTVFAKFRRTLN